MNLADTVLRDVLVRGDLAHLALLLWAGAASLFCGLVLRDLAAANRRFDDFVRELAHFNRRHGAGPRDPRNHTRER
jgi:hypothetical protein